MSKVKVKMVRSPIGCPPDQRATMKGLGLTRMNQERELEDTPAVRGMIFKVKHLIQADPPEAATRRKD
ncbi:MAG TPA: 50S ribosomal protein L30 [bacterium]|nr:50S ribosomal protein L30 [bacterium]